MESIDLTETVNANELKKLSIKGNLVELNITSKPNDIVFDNEGGLEVGRLSFKDNEMIFKGNADESAKLFFDYFLKGYVDEYIKEQIRKEETNGN